MDTNLLFNKVDENGNPILFNFLDIQDNQFGWNIILIGYKEAFKILGEEIINLKANNQQLPFRNLIFPFIFIFRHTFEIAIKELKQNCEIILKIDQKKSKTHTLRDDWSECKKTLLELHKKKNLKLDLKDITLEGFFDYVDSFVDEFIRIDEKSTNFRYPDNEKEMVNLIDSGIHTVDFTHIYNAGNKLFSQFLNLGFNLDRIRQKQHL
jgi:hypothetical protein